MAVVPIAKGGLLMMVNVLTGDRIDEEKVVAEKMISASAMLGYLQSMLDSYRIEKERYGDHPYLETKLDALIGCKEMAEALIGLPVNLGKDGKVTVGF